MSQQDNNKSNAFFSAFSGGGGGGSSSVTTASNVGTGVGVFKQKVLQDLEFKTLLEGKGINISSNGSGNEVDIELSTDVVGIADGTGWYTFYNSVSDAITSASAGQTITFFTNIVETSAVSLQLKDGITFDLNGFSYTLSSNNTTNMFQTPSGYVSVKFINGGLYRTNAIQTLTTNGLVFLFNNTFELVFDNSFVISNDGCSIIKVNGKFESKIYGGLFIGGNPTLNWAIDSSSNFTDSIFYTDTILNSGILSNCVIWNPSADDVYAISCDDGAIYNSYVRGTRGCYLSNSSINNCSIFAGNQGVYAEIESIISNCSIYAGIQSLYLYTAIGELPCRAINTFVKSTTIPALDIESSIVSNSYFETTSGTEGVTTNTCLVGGNSTLSNSTIFNDFGGTTALGILISSNDSIIVNNTIKMTSTDGYCIAGTSSNTAFLSSNVGIGTNTMIDTTNLTNVQVNTPDLYGNILIG